MNRLFYCVFIDEIDSSPRIVHFVADEDDSKEHIELLAFQALSEIQGTTITKENNLGWVFQDYYEVNTQVRMFIPDTTSGLDEISQLSEILCEYLDELDKDEAQMVVENHFTKYIPYGD